MSLPTVAVTCSASDQAGNPVAGAVYTARLDQTEIYNGLVAPETTTATANAQGVAVLDLWPNALGVNGSIYRVIGRHPVTGRKFFDANVAVPNSPCNLYQIIQSAPFPSLGATQQALISAQAASVLAAISAATATAKAAEAVASTVSFTIPFAQMANSIIQTQTAVVAHHGFA